MSQYMNPNHPAGKLYPPPHTAAGAIRKTAAPQVVNDGIHILSYDESMVYDLVRHAVDGKTTDEMTAALGFDRKRLSAILAVLSKEGLVRPAGVRRDGDGRRVIWMAA